MLAAAAQRIVLLGGGNCIRTTRSSFRKKNLMAYSRKFLTVGAMGVAAFALIGAGATASFNDSVTVKQDISAGRMNLTIAGNTGWSQAGGKTLTLPAKGPVGSDFDTLAQNVIVTNNGSVRSRVASLVITAPSNNAALRDGLRVRVTPQGSTSPIFEGTLAALQGTANSQIAQIPELAAGASTSATVQFYADDLPDAAQGGTVTPTFTVHFKG
jgi:predicted ribosomally synthesized peptide with SipW-like signal peptide